MITYPDFMQVDICVGTVVGADLFPPSSFLNLISKRVRSLKFDTP